MAKAELLTIEKEKEGDVLRDRRGSLFHPHHCFVSSGHPAVDFIPSVSVVKMI